MHPVEKKVAVVVSQAARGNYSCITCGSSISEVSNTEIRLVCGAILMDDATRSCGGPSDLLSGFMDLWFHQSQPHTAASLVVAKDVKGGQLEIPFCSIECVSRFFEELVSAFREQIAAAIAEAKSS